MDSFHFKGHVNCSHGYNSANLAILAEICTPLSEQKNGDLAKHKIQSIFMRFDCFTSLIRALTTRMNDKELRKARESLI